MLERWLAARDAEAVRSAWTDLAPCRHEISQRDRTLTLHGAALLAEAMLGERAEWIVNLIGRPADFQSRGEVDACFLDDAWNVNQWCYATWDLHEQRDNSRGVQVVKVGVGSIGGQPDGNSETVVRIFDRDRAASVRIGSNQVATIGAIDLAALDLLWFSQSHSMTTNPSALVAQLIAELHYDHGLPWGHRLEASQRAVYGQLPNADIERVIAQLAKAPSISMPELRQMPTRDEAGMWGWDAEGSFNPKYDVTASATGLAYHCEIQGPFCGYDAVGTQSWDEFLSNGPPADFQMPASIAAEIRAYAIARRPR